MKGDQTIMKSVAVLVQILVVINGIGRSEGEVKCHECEDMENGWCGETKTCEDAFCFKANVTLYQGKRHLRLGCVTTGPLGCEKQELQVSGMAHVLGDYCVCDSDYCNFVPRPSSGTSLRVLKFRFFPSCLAQLRCNWAGVLMTIILVYFGGACSLS